MEQDRDAEARPGDRYFCPTSRFQAKNHSRNMKPTDLTGYFRQ